MKSDEQPEINVTLLDLIVADMWRTFLYGSNWPPPPAHQLEIYRRPKHRAIGIAPERLKLTAK